MKRPSPGEDHPDDRELLAAFLDGRLSHQERAEVLRRATEDPAWRELLAESSRTIAELSDTREAAGPESAPERPSLVTATNSRSPQILLPLAAVVLLGVGLALWLPRWRADPLDTAVLAANLPASGLAGSSVTGGGAGEAWYESPAFPTMRSAAPPPAATAPAEAFLLGVGAVDLEVARARKDVDAAGFLAERIAEICLRNALGACHVTHERLALDPSLLWREPTSFSTALLETEPRAAGRLGTWAEAARIAARAGDQQFFQSSAWPEGLELLERFGLDPKLQELSNRLHQLPASSSSELEHELSELIRGVADRSLALQP